MERNRAEALPYPLAFFFCQWQPGPWTTWPMSQCPLGLCTPNFVFLFHCSAEVPLCKCSCVTSLVEEPSPRPPLHLQLLPDILSIHGDRELSCKEPLLASKSAVSGFVSNCDMGLPVWEKPSLALATLISLDIPGAWRRLFKFFIFTTIFFFSCIKKKKGLF